MKQYSGRITTLSVSIAIIGILTLIILSVSINSSGCNRFYTKNYNWKADGGYQIQGNPNCKSKNIYKEGIRYNSEVQPVWRYDTSGRWVFL
jgi:hypothetical protein